MADVENATLKPSAEGEKTYVDKYIDIFVDRPCSCFWTCCGIQFLLVVISVAFKCIIVDRRDGAWVLYEEKNTAFFLGYENSKEMGIDPLNDRRLAMPYGESNAGGDLFDRRLEEEDDGHKTFTFFYKTNKAGTGDIFTSSNIQKMCELEYNALFLGQRAEQIFSPITYFYGQSDPLIQKSWKCHLLDQYAIDAKVNQMWQDVKTHTTQSMFAAYVSKDFVNTGKSAYTKSMISVFDPEDMVWEDKILNYLDLSYGFLSSPYVGEDDRFVEFGAMRIRFSYNKFDETTRMIGVDLMVSILSVLFVWGVLWLYTKSFWIASWTIYQTVFSLPIAGVFYKLLFQVDYFEFLHVLIVYLVLGIGADDVFVVVDTVHHVMDEFTREPGKALHRDDLHAALKKAWLRSAGAIFNTSFTTCVAFLSSSISPVMPMRTCGWFAALCIVSCFVLTITFTPAVVVIHHTMFQEQRCCCPPCERRASAEKRSKVRESSMSKLARSSTKDSKGDKVALGGEEQEHLSNLNPLQKALFKGYIPFMNYTVGSENFRIRIGALSIVLIMLGVAIQGIVFMSRLTPPRTEEVWFPDNHMGLQYSEFVSSNYYTPDYDDYCIITFYWGVKELDYDEFQTYQTDENTKGVVYDSGFDLTQKATQDHILDVCEKLRTAACTLEGCDSGSYGTLRMQIPQKTHTCFLEDMRAELGGTLPTGPAFTEALLNFRRYEMEDKYSSPALKANYRENIGFRDGQLKWVAVQIRSTLAKGKPYESGIKVRDLVDDYWSSWKGSSPTGSSLKYAAEFTFAGYDLSKQLMNGFFSGCAISLPCAFLVLLFSTRNVVLALYAVITVAFIVTSVLGFCKSAMGWDFGIAECIAGVIVIGYSVDYVVHLAHIYHEGYEYNLMSREQRCAFAIQNLGTTIFAGAITTLGSGMVMFICYFYFFFKMALLITMTIVYSFLYSLGFFMGMLWLVGPAGTFGDIPNPFKKKQDLSQVVPAPSAEPYKGPPTTKIDNHDDDVTKINNHDD